MLRPVPRSVVLASVLTPLIASVACSKAEFSGDTGKRATMPPQVIEKTITLGCDDSAAAQTIELEARDTLQLKLAGEFCPTADNDLSVLFVLDASGSMGKHYETNGTNQLNPGNDPRQGDTCGRLAAMQAVIGQLQANSSGVYTRVGLVTFAGGIVESMDLVAASAFASSLSADLACSFVSQGSRVGYHPENPGAIRSSVSASTNYAAALGAAADMLGAIQGRKVVYFVSDGMPTSGGADPVATGIAAGERLRSLTDVTLNGLLLGQSGAAAKSVMTAVVGGDDRVRVAGHAGELATEITQFPAPSVDGASLVASLTRYGEESTLGVTAASATTPGAFGYVTQVVDLPGTPGATGETELSFAVAAKSADGQVLSAQQAVTVRRL